MRGRHVGALVGLFIVVLMAVFLWTGLMAAGMFGYGMMGSGYGYVPGMAVAMGLFWLLLLALIVGLVLWWLRSGSLAATGPSSRASDAEAILRDRYARGELTRAQYQEMLEDLRRDAR